MKIFGLAKRQSSTSQVVLLKRAACLLAGTLLLASNHGAEARDPDRMMRQLRANFAQASNRLSNSLPGRNEALDHPWHAQNVFDRLSNIQMDSRQRSGLINFDLTSQHKSILLEKQLFLDLNASVQINVGGELKTVLAGSAVTPGEFVAVKQVMDGEQKIILDRSGIAIGGDVNLSALSSGNDVIRASDLVIPESVTVEGDLGRHSDFRLYGELNNFGTLSVYSTKPSTKALIKADELSNQIGASIISGTNLTLEAVKNFSNEGNISSSGNLTIASGGSLSNTGKIEASSDLNIQAPEVRNRGELISSLSNVTFGAPDAVAIDNKHGTIVANAGSINLRASDYVGFANSTMSGGDLYSKQLNLNSGRGVATVDVNDLTGTVNESGSAAHVSAATKLLTLGSICLVGDPTYFNAFGDILINDNLLVAEALTIVAAGNISTIDNITIQAGDTGTGYPITLIAGADVVRNSGGGSVETIPTEGIGANITLTGKPSKTGGNIILGSNVSLIARSTDTAGDDKGARIDLIAFSKKTGTGVVDASSASLLAGGRNYGTNGAVKIIAGAKSGEVITTGEIDVMGGDPTSVGSVVIASSQPVTSGKEGASYEADGDRYFGAGAVIVGKYMTKGTDITVRNITSGNIYLDAGNSIRVEGSVEASHLLSARTRSGDLIVPSDGPVIAKNEIYVETGGTVSFTSGVPAFQTGRLSIWSKESIGTETNPLQVDTFGEIGLLVHSEGSMVNLAIVNPTSVGLDLSSTDRVLVDAPTSSLGGRIYAPSVQARYFNGQTFLNPSSYSVSLSAIGDSVSLTTLDPDYNWDDEGFTTVFYNSQNVQISSAGGFGSSARPVFANDVSNLTVVAADDIFVELRDKGTTVISFDTTGDANITSESSMVLGNAVSTNGSITATAASGVLTVDGEVSAYTSIALANNSVKSNGKIVFAEDASVQTTAKTSGIGDISISIGPTSVIPVELPIANLMVVETGGTVTLTGGGVKTKSPSNTITAMGADVTINNGFKAGNILLNGNVQITADPPVPEGTPSIIWSSSE